MRKYLATIHQRSPEHKKRFALLVSSGVTLLIFGIWSITTFGTSAQTVVQDENMPTPLESLKASIGTALKVLRSDVGKLEKGLETVHTNNDR